MTKFKKRFLIGSFLIVGFLIFGSGTKAEAQSFSLDPSSATITVSGTQIITIRAEDPPQSGSGNAAQIRLTVPTSLITITNYTSPGGSTLALTGAGCSAQYTAGQVCIDIAVLGGGYFTDGQSLGTFTIQGVANGVANANFVTNNQFVGSSQFTGIGGTYTVGAGGGAPVDGEGATDQTLPSTGIFDDMSFLWFGLTFVSGGLLIYTFNKNKKSYVFNHSLIDNFFNKRERE